MEVAIISVGMSVQDTALTMFIILPPSNECKSLFNTRAFYCSERIYIVHIVPQVQREEDQVRTDCSFAPTQLVLCLRFALLKGESWLRAVTLDDSQTPTPVLHNTSVVV